MPYVEQLMKKNFIEYASYVIKERAIPHLDDGLKPVQRRILHTLLEMDDNKFHKVANITGACTKYHPHGDAPIYDALISLASKGYFIERQGNFGNPETGDPASAARYIEAKISPLGKTLFYAPDITDYMPSYDGRNKEPVVFPTNIPLVLLTGAEGIAVVMATTILSHNFNEVIDALIATLEEREYELYPDFLSGGFIDVSEYQDGLGKVRMRVKLDTSDSKKIVIRELPYGITTERLMTSIENAAKSGKIQISGISDYTAQKVEIVITLARGVYTEELVDSLYTFTDCETSVSLNPTVIVNGKPQVLSCHEIISYYKTRCPQLLKAQLQVDKKKIEEKIHARTLERIFIEEEIYKDIETCKTAEAVVKTTWSRMNEHKAEFLFELREQDIDRLLHIPIRRISAYDRSKYQDELRQFKEKLKDIRANIRNIIPYTLNHLKKLKDEHGALFPRKTQIARFQHLQVKEVAKRTLCFTYDQTRGYVGYGLTSGKKIGMVSPYDRVLVFAKDGTWRILNVSEKQFVGKSVLSVGVVDKDMLSATVFTVVYTISPSKIPITSSVPLPHNKEASKEASKQTGKDEVHTYLKRFAIKKFLPNKVYVFVPSGAKIKLLTTSQDAHIKCDYTPAPRLKVLEEAFVISKYAVKSVSSKGLRLSTKKIKKVSLIKPIHTNTQKKR